MIGKRKCRKSKGMLYVPLKLMKRHIYYCYRT